MAERAVNNKDDLALLAISLHTSSNIEKLLRDAAPNTEYNGKYIVADIREGKEGIRSFDDLDQAIAYRNSLPKNVRFELYQPKLVRNKGKQT